MFRPTFCQSRELGGALLLAAAVLPLLCASTQQEPQRAFQSHPLALRENPTPLIRLNSPGSEAAPLEIGLTTYEHYLLARFGRSFAEDLALDLCLERACAAEQLAPDAVEEAQRSATEILQRFGGELPERERADRRVRIVNEEIRRLRTQALVRAHRRATDEQLRALFDEVHGVDGQKVKVRHLLVSWNGSEQRLREAQKDGRPPNRQEIRDHALARAQALRQQIEGGRSFYALLDQSDDPSTQTLLQNPLRRQLAGLIEDYNYQRYGAAFAEAVRALEPGEVSQPVLSSHGLHLILLVSREVTRFEDVREALRARFQEAPLRYEEVEELRKELFTRFGVEFPD